MGVVALAGCDRGPRTHRDGDLHELKIIYARYYQHNRAMEEPLRGALEGPWHWSENDRPQGYSSKALRPFMNNLPPLGRLPIAPMLLAIPSSVDLGSR